jgi:hypothetical protein
LKQYYIISLRHTSKGDTALLFFGPNNNGYTYQRDRAGRYSYEDAVKYSSEDSPMVECEKVDPFWMNAVDYNDKFIAVANTPAVRKAIGISARLMKPKKHAGCRMAFMNTPVAPITTLLLFILLLASCVPARSPYGCPGPVTKVEGDTIHEQMLLTMRPMGFAHSRFGLAVIRNGSCIAHLDCRGQPLKFPIRVWDCETERRRRAQQ